MPAYHAAWRRGVYVHDWGTRVTGPGVDVRLALDPPIVWWAVVLEAREWEVDGVWLVRHSPAAEAANLPLPDLVCFYHAVRFGPDRLRLPAAMPAGLEAELLARAEGEWVAAALGGYLPDAGETRTVRVGEPRLP
jgi:hypothetical protein